MQINSEHRILASEDWWDQMTSEQKKEYIEQHPNSKYAKDHIEQDEQDEQDEQPKNESQLTNNSSETSEEQPEVNPEDRKSLATAVRKASPKVASKLKKVFPRIGQAVSALKHIASGKPLEEEHKEVLHELGGVALKTLSTHLTGDVHLGKVLSHVGTHAIQYSIEKFKEHKAQNKNKDDVEVFVDGIAEGIENGEQSQNKSNPFPTGSVASHIKKSAGHIVEVLNRSFKHIKPATQGLANLAQGKPLDEEHKKAMKGLGKVALATSIAALPGGLAVHLGAGVGSQALIHAYKKLRGFHGHNILHHFVESIGEGLEDAMLEHAAGEDGGAE